MKKILNYLKPIIEDDNGQPSRKRLLEIMLIGTGCFLTTTTTFYKYYHPELDVPTITMLIAPLFASGLGYAGITTYYQNKANGKIQSNIDNGSTETDRSIIT